MKQAWTPEQVDLIRRMANDGITGTDIARHFGVTRNAILGLGKRKNITFHGRGDTAETKRRRAFTEAFDQIAENDRQHVMREAERTGQTPYQILAIIFNMGREVYADHIEGSLI